MNRDRRNHPRIKMNRPAKLRDQATGRYLPGAVVDYSPGGAMLQVDAVARLRLGQRLLVGISAKVNQPMLRATDMVPAIVVRSLAHDRVQHVAVAFEQTRRLAEAG